MKAKDIFRLVVRILGLVVFLYGLEALLEGVLGSLGLLDTKYGSPKYWAVRGVVEMIFGLLVMRGVISFTELAFPEEGVEAPQHKDAAPVETRDA